MAALSSAIKENVCPNGKEKHERALPKEFLKIPPQPELPGEPSQAASVFTLIQPSEGRCQRTGIILGEFRARGISLKFWRSRFSAAEFHIEPKPRLSVLLRIAQRDCSVRLLESASVPCGPDQRI